jgi:hypothetical protein
MRQSSPEQAENDRTIEYLLTCAKKAKELGVIVPREYITYDNETSLYFSRPGVK